MLPKWKPLLPLFEAVINALQAVQDASKGAHKVVVEIERGSDLGLDDQPPITGFKVSDTGVGFNDENFNSFNTSFSEYKVARGGKGLGRFIWLKAFEYVEIDSVFTEPDSDVLLPRTFIFNSDYDPDNAPAASSDRLQTGTVVRLVGFREPYKSQCPRTADQIAQRLIEHFLLIFLQEDCPRVEIHDRGNRLQLNQIFETEFRATASAYEFIFKSEQFTVHGFRLTPPRASRHRHIYAANDRGVVSDNLEDHIPNLTGCLSDGEGNSFVYLAIVQSSYLSQRVNNARTDFEIPGSDDAEADQPSLFADEIPRSDIREACIQFINEDLSDIINGINAAKEERILQYVQDQAPQYKILMKYRSEFIDRIPRIGSNVELDVALHRELHSREVILKREGTRIITEAAKLDNYDIYQEKLSKFMLEFNELGVSALAMHRRIIIDFLERAISIKSETNKYPLEKVVHDIIFPMRATSDDTLYSQQNLWLIDERLTYHPFVSSDKPLNTLPEFASVSLKRPDLFIFDRKIAFTEGEQPISSVMVVEFKRPQRDDYTETQNPLDQVFEMVQEIRAGQFMDSKRRPISVANDRIPAHCYVVCDLTPTMKKILISRDATATPDGQGFYGFHKNYGIYFEMIDYNKVVRDARRRNRIFFEKLNVVSAN